MGDSRRVPPFEGEFLDAWEALFRREMWERVLEEATADNDPRRAAIARRELDDVRTITALDALRANKRLTDLLIIRRWAVIRWARMDGASWEHIGRALGISKQGAHQFWRTWRRP